MCNRWAGGISLFLYVGGKPEFDGDDNIGLYRSSKWGERGFCKVCGSSLFWRLAGGEGYTLSAGTINEQSELRFTKEIYIEDQPAYYSFSNKTVRLTGPEAMAEDYGVIETVKPD
jgi:hypothetical protein